MEEITIDGKRYKLTPVEESKTDEYPKIISFRNIESDSLVELHDNGKYTCNWKLNH